MTNRGAAEHSIKRAEIVLQEAEFLSAACHWNLSVTRSQESVELALKGALAWAGIDVPKLHDVGPLLRPNAGRYPPRFAEAIPQLASISRALRARTGRSDRPLLESGTPFARMRGSRRCHAGSRRSFGPDQAATARRR